MRIDYLLLSATLCLVACRSGSKEVAGTEPKPKAAPAPAPTASPPAQATATARPAGTPREPQETCAHPLLNTSGYERVTFIDCNAHTPSQASAPECFLYSFERIQDEPRDCPPERLGLFITGWPGIINFYYLRVTSKPDGTIKLTTEAKPGDYLDNDWTGPPYGAFGEVLGSVTLEGGKAKYLRVRTGFAVYNAGAPLVRFDEIEGPHHP